MNNHNTASAPVALLNHEDTNPDVTFAAIYADRPDETELVGTEPPLWSSGALPTGPYSLGPNDIVISLCEHGGVAEQWLVLRRPDPLAGSRVLVVDDDATTAGYYADALAAVGMEVECAGSGQEMREALAVSSFDLCILDVRLPDANGFELCSQVLADGTIGTAAVLLMSAYHTASAEQAAASAGASGFLHNPIRPEVILDRSRAALRDHDTPLAARTAPRAAGVSRIQLFGQIEVEGPSGVVEIPRGRSAQILASLAAACPSALSLTQFERYAWSDVDIPSPNAVYTAMSRMRRLLQSIGVDPIVTDGRGYRLAVDPHIIDVVHFDETAHLARTQDRGAIEHALSLWSGEPLPGVSGALLDRWRNRLIEHRASLTDSLALAMLADGDAAEAEEVSLDLLADCPWRETTWAIAVVAAYRTSRTVASLDVLRSATDGLRERLGLDPGPALAGMEMMVLTHDTRLLDDEWLKAVVSGDTRALA